MEEPQQAIPATEKPVALIPIHRKTPVKKTQADAIIDKAKLDLFLEEYIRCDYNGTEAAMRVFNCKSRHVAGSLAQNYLKRAQSLGRIVLEKKGITYGKLIDKMWNRVDTMKDPTPMIDRLLKIGGYEDFLTKQGVNKTTVSVIEVQNELYDEFVEGEIVEETA